MHALEIALAGEPAALLAGRALHLPRHDALLVADVHLGKAASFRHAAIAVPEGNQAEDLDRLSALLAATDARRLLVLGDLLHARQGRGGLLDRDFGAWRARHAALEILLVRGNHDRHAGDPDPAWGIACADEPFALGPFRLLHHPPAGEGEGYALAGHVHPAVRLVHGRQRLRLRAFVLGPRCGLLPAFGSFTGSTELRPRRGDRVYVIAGDQVVAVRA